MKFITVVDMIKLYYKQMHIIPLVNSMRLRKMKEICMQGYFEMKKEAGKYKNKAILIAKERNLPVHLR